MLAIVLLIATFTGCAEGFARPRPSPSNFRVAPITAAANVRFLESNSWELDLGDVTAYIDPIMSQLDFGIPSLYAGNKKVIDGEQELQKISKNADVILISQGFDDHAHKPTLKRLAKMNNDIPYVCPPSAKEILLSCGIRESKITTVLPGEGYQYTKGKTTVELVTTNGALLGPPWAQKENGYIIRPASTSKKSFPSIYYEPHCMYDKQELSQYQADVVITPVVSQELPAFTLVAGGEKALDLAKVLKAKYVVPMRNGGLEQKGVLTRLIKAKGSEDEFLELAKNQDVKILIAPPGKKVEVK